MRVPASGLGELVGVSLATGEYRGVDSELSDVRCHYRGRRHALEGELHQHILGRQGGDSEHAREHSHRTVGIGEAAITDTQSQKPEEECSLQEQLRSQRGHPGPRTIAPDASVTRPSTAMKTGTPL